MRKRIRPETTLFLLTSVDGKISTGATDEFDFDRDLPHIEGVKEGLHQYYELEKETDFASLNTGRVMAKIGINERPLPKKKLDCQFIIIDNHPHLTAHGVEHLTTWLNHLYLVTTNQKHPAFKSKATNLTIIKQPKLDLTGLFSTLWSEYKVKRVTLQSGGNLNAALIRAGLVDHLHVVVAPLLVGGRDTSTLVDGDSIQNLTELKLARPLKLIEARPLKKSYLYLRYDVSESS